MMKGIALPHIPAGTFFQLDGVPFLSSSRVQAFMDREFTGH
jgi:hypothetical protein